MSINTGKFATSIKIEVNKKNEVTSKYDKLGEIAVFIPTLADAGYEAEQAKDEKGALLFEDGLPVYVADSDNWLQGAMLAQAKAQARNKLISGTATLKEGKTIADDWASLTAESEGVGNPAALLAMRETKNAFTKWVATLGKSAGAQAMLTQLFNSKAALQVQNAENKAKMEAYVTDFVESLDAATLEKGQRYIQSVLTACKAVEDAADF